MVVARLTSFPVVPEKTAISESTDVAVFDERSPVPEPSAPLTAAVTKTVSPLAIVPVSTGEVMVKVSYVPASVTADEISSVMKLVAFLAILILERPVALTLEPQVAIKAAIGLPSASVSFICKAVAEPTVALFTAILPVPGSPDVEVLQLYLNETAATEAAA